MKKFSLTPFLELMNRFSIKCWSVIYFSVLLSHILSIYFGYSLSTLGFLLSIVTYYIFLTKTKLWSYNTFYKGVIMLIVFFVITALKLLTDFLNFYEICFLLGTYEWVLLLFFYQLPIKNEEALYSQTILVIRNLLSIILLLTGLYYIPLGAYGMYQNIDSIDIKGVIFPLYLVSVVIVAISIAAKIIYEANSEADSEANKDQNYILTEDEKLDVDKIINFFSESDLYLKYNFTMDNLIVETGIKRKRLSYILNSCMHTNYYQLLAQYRIKRAKELLDKETGYTLEYISMQCGFTSPSVFIKYFKMFMGSTPKAYRENFVKRDDINY